MREVGARLVNFFKGVVGAVLIAVIVAWRGAGAMEESHFWLLVASGVVGLSIGDSVLFYALGRIGPHRAALFMSLSPVMTALGGWALGEILTLQQVVGVLAATAGVTLVVGARSPKRGLTLSVPMLALGAGALAALCQAVGVLLAKRGMPEGSDVYLATLVRLVAATVGLALYAGVRGWLRTDMRRLANPRVLFWIARAAAIGTFLGLLLMQVGIQRAESAVASALHSTTPLFTLPISVFLLKERTGPAVWAGSLLGVGGVLALLLA